MIWSSFPGSPSHALPRVTSPTCTTACGQAQRTADAETIGDAGHSSRCPACVDVLVAQRMERWAVQG